MLVPVHHTTEHLGGAASVQICCSGCKKTIHFSYPMLVWWYQTTNNSSVSVLVPGVFPFWNWLCRVSKTFPTLLGITSSELERLHDVIEMVYLHIKDILDESHELTKTTWRIYQSISYGVGKKLWQCLMVPGIYLDSLVKIAHLWYVNIWLEHFSGTVTHQWGGSDKVIADELYQGMQSPLMDACKGCSLPKHMAKAVALPSTGKIKILHLRRLLEQYMVLKLAPM